MNENEWLEIKEEEKRRFAREILAFQYGRNQFEEDSCTLADYSSTELEEMLYYEIEEANYERIRERNRIEKEKEYPYSNILNGQ